MKKLKVNTNALPTRVKHLAVSVVIFISEILIATVFSDIKFIRNYFGDLLVVMLIYHFIKIFRDVLPWKLGALVFLLACGVEALQYFQLADIMGFARGSLPSIIIGTSFSWHDILMYFLGCVASCFLDMRFFYKSLRSPRYCSG